MREYEVDMTAPEPSHEAAYSRILRVIRSNQAFIYELIKTPAYRLKGNWKLILVRKHRDIVALKGLWDVDEDFRQYLGKKLSLQFGAEYTENLIRIFLA